VDATYDPARVDICGVRNRAGIQDDEIRVLGASYALEPGLRERSIDRRTVSLGSTASETLNENLRHSILFSLSRKNFWFLPY
jgi:hypothetical protein